jgi:wyosine [tRNA(Phe)-imidazoG37] synthetase (radical SAM superfamily)
MTKTELLEAYALAARPYVDGKCPVPASALASKSWRYLIELNTACNLRCVLCTSGNLEGYDYPKGNRIMELTLLERILLKMQSENPQAIVCPYGNGEPFLHPKLPECIAAIKRYGFNCELATNLNRTNRLDEVLQAAPDLMIVSVSGFTQDVYGKNHQGGDIEKVKANLKILKEASVHTGSKVNIVVSYHKYDDNLHEIEPMRQFVEQLGFTFWTSWARTISIENTVQSLRFLSEQSGERVEPYKPSVDGKDFNQMLPPAKTDFLKNMDRLKFHPQQARQFYDRFPVSSVCIIADVFTYIRHDGSVQLCAWCNDQRLTLGNYLEMDQEQLSAARRGNPLCQECLRYRLNLYYHIIDSEQW